MHLLINFHMEFDFSSCPEAFLIVIIYTTYELLRFSIHIALFLLQCIYCIYILNVYGRRLLMVKLYLMVHVVFIDLCMRLM